MLTLNQSNASQNNLAAHVEQQQQQQHQNGSQQYQNQFSPYSNLGSMHHQQPMSSGSNNFGSAGGGNGGNGSLTNLNIANGFINDSCRSFNNLQAILQQCNQLNQSVHTTTASNVNVYGTGGGGNVNQSNAGGLNGTNSGSSTSARSSMGLRGWSAQQHQLQQSQRQGSTSPLANCSLGGNGYGDVNLDRIARYHRSSAGESCFLKLILVDL